MSEALPNLDAFASIPGGGEMGERTRAFDWSTCAVGPIASWPQNLKTAVGICLGSRHPIVMWWGRTALTMFYNDGYIPMLGPTKHPAVLGGSGRECWKEIWHIIDPMMESVFTTGQATWSEDLLLVLDRNVPREEGYFTFSYSPIREDSGAVAGIFCAVTETTGRVIGERRLRTLRDLGRTVMAAKTADEACEVAAGTLGANPADIPFALVYLLDGDSRHARLVSMTGLKPGHAAAPERIDLGEPADSAIWPLRRVFETGAAEAVSALESRFGPLPGGPWPESPEVAVALPIAAPGQPRPTGFLVAGFSPRRVVDADYRSFFDLVAGHVATAVANARAYEEERRRAEALAEIDRAKTAFFSNVSHEFRTPLTLMLGPIEDLLARGDGDLSPSVKGQLEVVNRNGLRLLRLVNTLLDFSRIEAGRVRAVYRPTDLAGLTADLASVFRAAVERGGLKLTVDCPTLPEPVYVDREMWEKIVLNLVSNAFKFTFEGEIAVSVRQVGSRVELRVRDTGTGIPASEIPRLFERFHRVQNARGRTYEGSGIGLALVQELVKLHSGSIAAESELDRGTTFTVALPLGSKHLPAEQIGDAQAAAVSAARAASYADEALHWLPSASRGDAGLSAWPEPLAAARRTAGPAAEDGRPRVLVADDNADMRQYIARLLAEHYRVEAVADGEAALAAAGREPADLVLSDVMMPRLDGFGLLRELRANPRTRGVPIILLSARAGEESRVEGLEAGADDYLVKPFAFA
ncbi:MAG TPA: ATP-binding protein, partial [Myxococcales bacterium]|nr:ATP-binding protein [Myxococcales bacterium]